MSEIQRLCSCCQAPCPAFNVPAPPLHRPSPTPPTWNRLQAATFITGRISKVTDGDTLVINGLNIRLHGIDAPELRQTCQSASGASYTCGELGARPRRMHGQWGDLAPARNALSSCTAFHICTNAASDGAGQLAKSNLAGKIGGATVKCEQVRLAACLPADKGRACALPPPHASKPWVCPTPHVHPTDISNEHAYAMLPSHTHTMPV